MYYYNPLDKQCKSTVGAVEQDCPITFQVLVSGDILASVGSCYIVFYGDEREEQRFLMKPSEDGFQITLSFPQSGLYFYYFLIDRRKYERGDLRLLRPILDENNLCSYQLTVYDKHFTVPEWMKGGVMYQIFPDRFCKVGENPVPAGKLLRSDWGGTPSYKPNERGKVLNNDFFGGNISGIISKLDYLKSLGVTLLYFNPIFKAYSNHRYDTGDYMEIDEIFGTEEEFDLLVKKAKELGIRIILDGVFNHTGDNSRYFNKYGCYDSLGAFQSPNSPYINWYHFINYPNKYDCWWGIDILPTVNKMSRSYQEFIFGEQGVLHHWLNKGIDGFRLDVADELPDFFLKKLRTSIKSANPDALVLGEVWEDASNKISYSVRREYFQGNELDSVMNYPLKDAIIDFLLTKNTDMLRNTVFMLIDHYPKKVLDCLMNILGTHDTPRILTVMGGKSCSTKEEMEVTFLSESEKAAARERLKIASLLQFTLPGVPCIYYGDENSMEGYLDPFCRRCYDWKHSDDDMKAHYRMLGKLRTDLLKQVFEEGEYREIFADTSCLVYERFTQNESATIFVNLSHKDYRMRFQTNDRYKEVLSGKCVDGACDIKSNSYGIFVKESYMKE